MILLSIFLLVLAMHAYSEAHGDAMAIADGQDIDHGWALIERVVNGFLITVLMIAYDAFHNGWWHCLLMLPIGWAWWTMLFRFCLNRMRGNDWYYIGPIVGNRGKNDSWYDGFWHELVWGLSGGEWIYFTGTLDSGRLAKYDHDLPGKVAYSFELTILAASLATYFTTT